MEKPFRINGNGLTFQLTVVENDADENSVFVGSDEYPMNAPLDDKRSPSTMRMLHRISPEAAEALQRLHNNGIDKWQIHYFVEMYFSLFNCQMVQNSSTTIELHKTREAVRLFSNLTEALLEFPESWKSVVTENFSGRAKMNRECFKFVHNKLDAPVTLYRNVYSCYEMQWRSSDNLKSSFQQFSENHFKSCHTSFHVISHSLSSFQMEKMYKILRKKKQNNKAVNDNNILSHAIKIIQQYPVAENTDIVKFFPKDFISYPPSRSFHIPSEHLPKENLYLACGVGHSVNCSDQCGQSELYK